jgi:hypothetical protein
MTATQQDERRGYILYTGMSEPSRNRALGLYHSHRLVWQRCKDCSGLTLIRSEMTMRHVATWESNVSVMRGYH